MTYMTHRLPIAIFIALLSVASLTAAFIAEHVFGLMPCQLCIWQRWPYAIGIILGIALIFLHQRPQLFVFVSGLIAINFAVNSGIAIFHTGVEQKWWAGLEGCSAPDLTGSVEDIIARIEAAPMAKCSELAWKDPVLGLTFANINAVLGFILAAFFAAVAIVNFKED